MKRDVDGGNGRMRRPRTRTLLATVSILLTALGAAAVAAQERVTRYAIDVLARPTLHEAMREAAVVRRELGPDVEVRVEHRMPNHVVRLGDFASVDDAQPLLRRIVELGYEDASITPILLPETEPVVEEPGTRTDAKAPPDADVPAVTEEVPKPADTELPPAEVPPALEEPEARVDGKQIRASRISESPPTIDGWLDEPAWAAARFVSDFQKKGAWRGFAATERTEVAILYDDDALYIGARVEVPDRALLRARRSQRDDAAEADRLIVSLDTYRNRQTAYNFGVTAGGARLDYYQPQDVFEVRDYSFDPVWEARTAVDAAGWSAEMRIPFSSLRFHGGSDSPVWGINIQRVSPGMRLYAFWVVVPGNETGWASRFGDLVGLDGVRPPRRLAVVPYVVAQTVRSDLQPDDGPFGEEDEVDWRYGGDFFADITPGLSVEATFNPDFGQIEADPAVLNLSAYEVFLPEKRPFFLEGAQLLRGPGPRYYYSRRIGARPHGRVNAPIQDVPVNTTISGAAKVIGRQAGGWSIGSLLALTEEEEGRTFNPETGELGAVPVEPRTFYGVGRLQKDLGAGSTFGFSGTGVRRDFPDVGTLESLLPRQAYTGGVDWNLRFADQSYEFRGFAGSSSVEGDPAAISRLQRASSRYLHRPDADYVGVDAERTKLEGYTAGLQLGRIKGGWRWTMSGEARSPGFEINDAGAMATADDLSAFGQVGYRSSGAVGPWRLIDASASVASGWNFGQVHQYTTPAVDLGLVWRSFWRTYLRVARDTRALSDSLTRGGPLMGTGSGWRSRFGISSNSALPRIWSLDGSYSTDELGGWSHGASTQFLVRFADRYTFSVTPGYERALNVRQYYVTLAGDRVETFNQRYIFAAIDQETVYARLRLGLSITSKLGFDLYIEPFAARGTYDRFGELAAARSRDLRPYGTDGTTITRLEDGSYVVTDGDASFPLADGDFDIGSLRGNAVLRWDYAPGSTLYLVWAQTRDAEDVLGEQLRPGALTDLLDAPAQNILAVKASFRLGND